LSFACFVENYEYLSQKYVDAPTDKEAPGLKIVIRCCTSMEPTKTPTEIKIEVRSNLTSEKSAAKIEPICTPTIEIPMVLGKIIPSTSAGKKRIKSENDNSPFQLALAMEKPKIRLRIVPMKFGRSDEFNIPYISS
jgi:hypothetical protein